MAILGRGLTAVVDGFEVLGEDLTVRTMRATKGLRRRRVNALATRCATRP